MKTLIDIVVVSIGKNLKDSVVGISETGKILP